MQKQKIIKGQKILKSLGINSTVWVAPAHGLDTTTAKALKDINDLKIISDGFSFRPYKDHSLIWIPQQIWRFRKMPFGVWTICLHPSEMTANQIKELEKFITLNKHDFISVDVINVEKNKATKFLDKIFSIVWSLLLKIKLNH